MNNVLWSLYFNGDNTAIQVLYYFGRPVYSFQYKEVKKKPKTIRENRSPCSVMLTNVNDQVWVPISIEIPTRPMPFIEKWLEYGKRNLIVTCHKLDGSLLEEWNIKDASVIARHRMIGRYIGVKVNDLLVKYSWAGRIQK